MAPTEGDPLAVGPSPVHGHGVFTRVALARGVAIGTFEGTPTDVDGDHVLWIEDGEGGWRGVQGTGVLRWLNHSRSPNVVFDGTELRTLRPIAAGEELLVDYGEEWADVP